MARIETTHLVDDLDGGEAAETVEFTVGKVAYEIDLSRSNAAAFRKTMEPYVAVARRATSGTRPATASRRSSSAADRELNQEIRDFARKRGMKVADRGRIPAPVLEAWESSGPRAVAS